MWGLREREVKSEAKFEGLNNGKENITRSSGVKVGRLSQKEKQALSFGQVEFEVSVGHLSGDVR